MKEALNFIEELIREGMSLEELAWLPGEEKRKRGYRRRFKRWTESSAATLTHVGLVEYSQQTRRIVVDDKLDDSGKIPAVTGSPGERS